MNRRRAWSYHFPLVKSAHIHALRWSRKRHPPIRTWTGSLSNSKSIDTITDFSIDNFDQILINKTIHLTNNGIHTTVQVLLRGDLLIISQSYLTSSQLHTSQPNCTKFQRELSDKPSNRFQQLRARWQQRPETPALISRIHTSSSHHAPHQCSDSAEEWIRPGSNHPPRRKKERHTTNSRLNSAPPRIPTCQTG